MDIKAHVAAIRDALEEFSSSEYQERVWLKGLGPEVSSYIEAVCTLFDDFGFEDLINSPEGEAFFDDEQIAIFKNFIRHFRAFDARIPEIPRICDILEDKRWPTIRLVAKKAVDTIDRSLAKQRQEPGSP